MAPMRHFVEFLWAQTEQPAIRYFTLKNPEPEPSFVWVILNTFFFIGVALAITIAIGVAFGGFRLWLLNKFPYNWFNGADKEDLSETFRLND